MKIHMRLCKLGIAVLMASSAMTTWAGEPAKVSDGVLTDSRGMTLYTTDRDSANSGKSVCTGSCADNWPPFMARDSDKAQGNYTVITRDDGKKQWAYNGKPLYRQEARRQDRRRSQQGVACRDPLSNFIGVPCYVGAQAC